MKLCTVHDVTLFTDVTSTWLFVYLKDIFGIVCLGGQRTSLSTARYWGKPLPSYFHKAPKVFPLQRVIQSQVWRPSYPMSSEAMSLFCKSPSWGRINIIIPILHTLHSRSIFNSQKLNFPDFYMTKLNSNHMAIKNIHTHWGIVRFQKEILFHIKTWSIVAWLWKECIVCGPPLHI
jgi:hypothetical protein